MKQCDSTDFVNNSRQLLRFSRPWNQKDQHLSSKSQRIHTHLLCFLFSPFAKRRRRLDATDGHGIIHEKKKRRPCVCVGMKTNFIFYFIHLVLDVDEEKGFATPSKDLLLLGIYRCLFSFSALAITSQSNICYMFFFGCCCASCLFFPLVHTVQCQPGDVYVRTILNCVFFPFVYPLAPHENILLVLLLLYNAIRHLG